MFYISLYICYYFINLFKVRPGSCNHACFYPPPTRRSDGLHLLLSACQRNPSQGRSVRRLLLPFVSCQDWHVWISAHYCLVLQHVSQHLGHSEKKLWIPLRSWGFPFQLLMSSVFWRRLQSFRKTFFRSSNFFWRGFNVWFLWLIVSELLRFSFRPIFSAVSALVARLIFSFARPSVGGLFSCPLFLRGSQKDFFALVRGVPYSLLTALCSCCPLKNKVSMGRLPSIQRDFNCSCLSSFSVRRRGLKKR